MLRVLASPVLGFVKSPELSLEVDHLVVGEGGHTWRRVSLLQLPTEFGSPEQSQVFLWHHGELMP
jgi:hypothetical protein